MGERRSQPLYIKSKLTVFRSLMTNDDKLTAGDDLKFERQAGFIALKVTYVTVKSFSISSRSPKTKNAKLENFSD